MEEAISEPSDEQTEPAEGDNRTPVIEEETTPEEDPVETPEETPEVTPEETPEVAPEEPSEDTIVLGSQIDAVTPAATTITVEQYEMGGTPATTEGGHPTDKKLENGAVAEVTFIDGTSADDSKALGGDRPVKFRVDLKDGWKTDGLTVVAVIAKSGDMTEDKTETLSADGNGNYMIATNVAEKAAQGGNPATPAGYSGNITIKITASPVKSTVKLSAAPATGQIVCQKKGEALDTTKAITNESGLELIYADSTKNVTLAVSDLSGKYRKITAKIGEGEATTVYSSGTQKAGTPEKTYDLFTFKPSALAGFNTDADNEVTITLETSEAAKTLTLAALNTETTKWGAGNVANLGTTAAYINAKADGSAFDLGTGESLLSSLDEDNYATDGAATPKDRVLAFTVTPKTDAGLKLAAENPVKAEISGGSNYKKTVNATKVAASGTGEAAVPEHYEIKLKDAVAAADFANGNLTLTIKVDTVVDSTAAGVHTITFEGDDLKNVTLGQKNGENFDTLTSPYTAKMDDITFGIRPKAGYTLKKGTDYSDGGNSNKTVVTVSYDKVYALKTNDDTPVDVKATVKVTGEEIAVADDSDVAAYLAAAFKFKDSTNYKDADWENGLPSGTAKTKIATDGMADGKAEYTKENVKVTVKTELVSDASGIVTIVSYDADYEVSGDGITKLYGDNYAISDEATLLTLKITSDVEPAVTYDEDTEAEVEKGEAEGSYVAEIPVNLLATDSETGRIDDTILIEKGTKDLIVTSSTDDDEDDEFTGEIRINGDVEKPIEGTISLMAGLKANVTIMAPVGTELTGVTTKLGNAEAEAVELKETEKTSVTFPVTMTEDVTVEVSLKSVYAATVTLGDKTEFEEPNKEGVYVIPEGTQNIKVSLFKGDATDVDNASNINYVKIYDGSEIAVTTATVTANTATIASISDKDTGVLKVDLAAAGSNKVVASVQIKQEKATAKLAVKDAKNKAVTKVSLMADGPAVKYAVTAADGGHLDYAAENIGVEVVAAADTAPVDTPVTKNDYVEAVYANGELTITALPAMEGKADAAVIRFYDIAKRAAAKSDTAATDKICLMADAITVSTTNPTVIGQKPTVKEATGSDKVLRVELSADKVVKPVSNNKILYKVEIAGTGIPEDVEKVQYFEKTKWGKETQLAEIVVDKTTVDSDGKRVEGSAKDFSLKVELVQTTKQTENLTGDALITAVKAEAAASPTTLVRGGDKAIAELKKISTRNPLYETKLKMKPASVTVYTQQSLASAQAHPQTQAQFDKKTGYTVVPYVQFVNTKTGVLLGTSSYSSDAASYNSWKATVDLNGNVAIGYSGYASKNLPKDIGLKVTAEYPEGAYASTAIVKITVVNGIESIDFVSGAIRSVYKQAGKAASLKLTPILNGGSKDEAPKKKNLTYAMGDATGKLPGEGGYTLDAEIAAKVKVNPKNGAVTVDKSYDLTKGDNQFSVVAQAADYEGNNGKGTVYVEITGTPQSLGDVVIVDSSNKVIARNGGTLKAEDFWADQYDESGLQVKVLKPSAGSKRLYSYTDFIDGVSYTSSAKAVLGVDAANGYLSFLKPDKKPVKLTVSAADGSKSKQEMSVTVKGYSTLGLEMYDSNNVHYDARELTHTYDGAMNEMFTLTPVAGMWDDYYQDVYSLGYTNLSVSLKGAKMVSKSPYGWPDAIVMTAPEATVTIQDKSDKDVKTVYTIKQEPAADSKAKAPRIAQVGKLTAADVEKARTEGGVDVSFQVTTTDKNYTPKNHARQYVFLAPDFTKTKNYEYDRASEYFLNYAFSKIVQIDDNGRFKLDLNLYRKDTFSIVPGTYSLIATVGTYADGKFAPAAKGVNVKINIPGKAAKDSLTVKGKYTLDTSAMAPVDLASGKNIATDYYWTLSNAAVNGNYAMNKIDPKTGKPNKFTDYFEVTGNAVNGFKLGLKAGLTKKQIEDITSKDGKADCEGYVTVSSYSSYTDTPDVENGTTTRSISGYRQTKDMKITVTFKDAKYVAKTLEPSVYAGAEASVKIYETAKSTTPIALAGAVIVADDKNGGAALVNTTTGVEADNQTLKVKFASAEAGKSYKVTLKILAADSAYAAMTAEGTKDYKALAESNGRIVTATIKVSGKDDKTKNKVAVTGKAFKISADDFTTAQANTYTLAIPVKSAIEGTTISAAAVPATVKDKAYEGKDIVSAAYDAGKVTLTVKRDELIKANAEKSGKFKFTKTVDVPVEFTFADSAVAKETVTLKVTLPNPMTFEKAVEAATKLEPVIGAMQDDKLFVNAEGMQADLKNRINAAINSALPKDVQATVSRGVELTPETKDGKTSYKTKVTVFKGATKADGDYEKEYTFAQAEAIETDASDLATAIEALTIADLTQLGNDYTPAKLIEDVKAALAKQEPAVKIPVNLSLSVDTKTWRLKKATAEKAGSLNVEIVVRDRNNASGSCSAEIVLTIAKLGNLSETAGYIEAALAEKTESNNGVNYNAVISTALGTTGAKTSVEAALKKAIEDAAKAAIKNPDISVKGFEKIEKAAVGSDNPTTATAPAKAMVDVDFKLPTGSTDGSVSFILILQQTGMKDLKVDYKTTPITVTAKTITGMAVTGKDASGETPTDLTISEGKATVTDVEGAKSLKFEAKITGTQLTDADKEVVFELVTQATAPDGDGKTVDDIPKLTSLPVGVTLTTNADGSVTVNVAANATWTDNKITLYLRAQKKLKKLYSSDETEIAIANRTQVITIELQKKAEASGGGE